MMESGVSTGFDDGTYRPGTDVMRPAAAPFMFRVSPTFDCKAFDTTVTLKVMVPNGEATP